MQLTRLISLLTAFNRSFSSTSEDTPKLLNIISNNFKPLDQVPNNVQIFKLVPIKPKNLRKIGKSIPLINVVAVPSNQQKSKRNP